MYRLADAGFEYEGQHYAMLTVHSANEEAAAKADGWAGHPCDCKPAKPADIVAAVADMADQIAKMDPDGDGRIGGSLKGKRKPRQRAVKRDPS